MARPAIIIGLGGTGQWVLTFLKKELLELGGGTMPPDVKLIAFDTTSQTMAEAGHGGKREDKEAVRAGAVELIEGKEFIPIGDSVMKLAAEIADERHLHLQWFPARSFLGKLPPSTFNLKFGSGQLRQMGRIALFRDLSAIANSKILSYLRSAMQDLQGRVSRDLQLEVIIVGSLAGGTGAGMLVDLALLVRAQAGKLVQDNHIIRGFFVLPRAFAAGGLGENRDMMARSFAAWRELDRFMIVSEGFGLHQMNYHAQNRDLRIQIDKRAYDVSYMVDPARQTTNSLDNIKAEEGLFPSLAHCISAILDDKAGQAYTEFVATNLASKLHVLPRRPYHSAIGSYTLKVPVYYAREKFSHQLALEVLDEFLAPEINDKGRVTRVSELRNREVAEGDAGKRAVLSFMGGSGLNIGGQEIPNTGLLPLMAEIRDKEGQREAAVINQWARGGLTNARSRVLLALTDISQDEEGKVIMRNITDELQLPIWREVPPSRVVGDSPNQAFTRVKNRLPEVRHEHYGLDTVAGERLRGKYGKALDEAKSAQVARFRKLLQAWTLNALNGQSEDMLKARGGKIGYVQAFYEELTNNFHYFIGFLNKVHQNRSETLKLASRAKEAARRALLQYDRERSKKCWVSFWDDFTHPDAHRAQRNYLLAEQRSIDVRKDDILLDVLAESAAEMQAIAEKTRDEVNNWIAHLATGDPGFNIAGLYAAAVHSLDNVNVNHELDRRLSKVSQIVGEHEYKSDETYVGEALERLKWRVEPAEDGLQLTCGVETPVEDPGVAPSYEAFRREGDNPSQYNLDMLIHLAERPYQTLHQDRPIAREIIKKYNTGTKLAVAVDKLAEPLYMTSATPQGPQIVACYIRIHSDLDEQTTSYFEEFEAEMKARNPNIEGASLTLVDSEDTHKLTIVRSDDLVPSADFEMWHACREAYINQVTDPQRPVPASELHIFPAEINACYYEGEMPNLLRKDYRTLHPEVVALLEDRERFEMFFLAVALEFIRVEESEGWPFWVYQLSTDDEPLYITVPVKVLGKRPEADIFQVIHNFVMEGRDQRPGVGQVRRVDWDKLLKAILSQQRELGKTKAASRYRQQIKSPKGIVQQIKDDVEHRRARVHDAVLRATIGQEHDDMADLATVVYLRAIESVKSFS